MPSVAVRFISWAMMLLLRPDVLPGRHCDCAVRVGAVGGTAVHLGIDIDVVSRGHADAVAVHEVHYGLVDIDVSRGLDHQVPDKVLHGIVQVDRAQRGCQDELSAREVGGAVERRAAAHRDGRRAGMDHFAGGHADRARRGKQVDRPVAGDQVIVQIDVVAGGER